MLILSHQYLKEQKSARNGKNFVYINIFLISYNLQFKKKIKSILSNMFLQIPLLVLFKTKCNRNIQDICNYFKNI